MFVLEKKITTTFFLLYFLLKIVIILILSYIVQRLINKSIALVQSQCLQIKLKFFFEVNSSISKEDYVIYYFLDLVETVKFTYNCLEMHRFCLEF